MNKYQKQNAMDYRTMKNIWTNGMETLRVKNCKALNDREYFDWICNHDYDVGMDLEL